MFISQQGDLTDLASVALLPATALSPLLSLSPLSAAMHNWCVLDTFPAPAVVIIYQKKKEGRKKNGHRQGQEPHFFIVTPLNRMMTTPITSVMEAIMMMAIIRVIYSLFV